MRARIRKISNSGRLTIDCVLERGCRSGPSGSRPCFNKRSTMCVISEGCYLHSVQPDSIWSCLHRVCRLRVRDCPFPPRINNKIIITKSTNTTKASFSPSYIVFFPSLPPSLSPLSHTRTKQGDTSFRDARCVKPGNEW